MRKILATNYMCQKCNKKKPFFLLLYLIDTKLYQWINWSKHCQNPEEGTYLFFSCFFFLCVQSWEFFCNASIVYIINVCCWLLFAISHPKMCSLFNNFEHPVLQRVCLPQFEGILFVLLWISNISLCFSSFHHTKFHILLFLVFVFLLNLKMTLVVLAFHYFLKFWRFHVFDFLLFMFYLVFFFLLNCPHIFFFYVRHYFFTIYNEECCLNIQYWMFRFFFNLSFCKHNFVNKISNLYYIT